MANGSHNVELNEKFGTRLNWIVFAAFAALLFFGWLAGVLWLAAFVVVLYTVASYQVMQAHEIGIIFGFGYPLRYAKIGLNFVPLGLMQMVKVPRAPHQKQFPEEPEMVFQGPNDADLPILADGRQQVRPIRIISGKPRPTPPGTDPASEEKEMVVVGKDMNDDDVSIKKYYDGPLNIQITVMMTGTVRWVIIPEKFLDFWTQLPGETAEEKIEDLDRQLQDTFVDVCKREWQLRPYGMIIDDDREIEEKIKKELIKEIDGQRWGIRLLEINLYPPDAGHDLNKQLSRIGEAKAMKEQTMAKADGELYEKQKEAAGRLAIEMADTEAAAHRAEKLGMTGREVIGLETAHAMLNDKDKFFFGADGIAQAVAAGTTVLDALRDKPGNPKDQKPKETPE